MFNVRTEQERINNQVVKQRFVRRVTTKPFEELLWVLNKVRHEPIDAGRVKEEEERQKKMRSKAADIMVKQVQRNLEESHIKGLVDGA